MTLEQFLKPFCVVKDNVIIIKNSKDEILYKIDGVSLHDTKCAYYDIRLRVHIYIDTRDLESEVTNWGCWQDKLTIYIRDIYNKDLASPIHLIINDDIVDISSYDKRAIREAKPND